MKFRPHRFHSPPAIASSSRSGATQQARHCHGVPCYSTPCQVPPPSVALTPRSGASRRPSEEHGDWIEDPCLPFLDEWLLGGSRMTHGRLIVQSQPIESSLLYMEWSKNNLYCIRPRLIDGYSWWFSPCWSNVFFHVFVTVKSPMYWWLTPTEIEAAHPSRSGY